MLINLPNFIFTKFIKIIKSFIKKTIFFKFYSSLIDKSKTKNYFSKVYNHEIMLADKKRLNSYEKLIKKYVGIKDIVCDLGTGTGLLALLASKENPKRIYAIEHSNIINIARKIAIENNIKNINFVNVNSKKFSVKEKISIILHEQIGNAIFDEDMISNVVDLRERLLKRNGQIIPNIFELYLEPISLIEYFKINRIYENNYFDIDYRYIKSFIKENFNEMNYRIIPRIAVKKILSLSSPIFSFNLNTINNQNEVPIHYKIKRILKSNEKIDGFCIFFKAKYNDELLYNTMQDIKSHPMSWGIPFYRLEKYDIENKEIHYTLSIKDILKPSTWEVKIKE